MATAQQIIAALRLEPHPIEGGYLRETYRASGSVRSSDLPPDYPREGARSLGTSIYYLLTPETFSELHRLPTEEIFHVYLGGPVRMLQLFGGGMGRELLMGADILGGQEPQVVVPAGVWQGSMLEPGVEIRSSGGDDGSRVRLCRLRARQASGTACPLSFPRGDDHPLDPAMKDLSSRWIRMRDVTEPGRCGSLDRPSRRQARAGANHRTQRPDRAAR